MGVFGRWLAPVRDQMSVSEYLRRVRDGDATWAGVNVTPENALTVSAVFACVRAIAEDIGKLPFVVYQANEAKERATASPYWRLIHDRFNSYQTSQQGREYLTACALLRGNGYALKNEIGGQVRELLPLRPDAVRVEQLSDWELVYHVTMPDGREEALTRREVFHLPGLTISGPIGVSVIEYARQTVGNILGANRHSGTFFGNGLKPSGVLKHPKTLSKESQKRLKEQLTQEHGGGRSNSLLLLEEGLDYAPITLTNKDSQFLECVVPGTLISMADGRLCRVEELRAGDEVIGWNDGPVKTRVAAVGVPPSKPLVRLTTARGRELVATYDHPVLARRRLRTPGCRPTKTGDEWIPMGDLEPGNYVRIGLGQVGEDAAGSDDIAWLLGAMVGDGYIRAGECAFSGAEPAVVERVARIVGELGGQLVPAPGRPNDWRIKTGGRGCKGSRLSHLWQDAALVGTHSHTKRVPAMVMAGGPRAWRGFLAGYFDTDGSIRKPGGAQKPALYWASVNRDLLVDCQHLLALLGINAAIYAMGGARKRLVMGQECEARPGWGLYVTAIEQIRALSGQLDLAHPEKAARLAEYATFPPSRYRDLNRTMDRVVKVEQLPAGETIGVEIEGCHTHITAGIVTHNSRAFEVTEVCRWFRVPPHKIADLDRATFSNIEHQAIEYVSDTLMPWAKRWEYAVNQQVIRTNTLYAELLFDALLRGTTLERYQAYQIAAGGNAPFMSRAEVRQRENLPPIEGLDEMLKPLNMSGEEDSDDNAAGNAATPAAAGARQ